MARLHRRRVLGLLGTAAATVAGCSGPGEGDDEGTDDDPNENEPEDGEGESDDDDAESVGAPGTRRGVQ